MTQESRNYRDRTLGEGASERLDQVVNQERAADAAKEAAIILLIAQVEACEKQFKYYVEQHMAKSPPDIGKAEANQKFATDCAVTLAAAKAAGLK